METYVAIIGLLLSVGLATSSLLRMAIRPKVVPDPNGWSDFYCGACGRDVNEKDPWCSCGVRNYRTGVDT